MHIAILAAGFGGQGIKLLSQLLGSAVTLEGKAATMYADYKDEIRGGAIQCTVQISDEEVWAPTVTQYDILIAMNEDALTFYEPTVKSGGLIIYNSAIVKTQPKRSDVEAIPLPANKLAEELGSVQVASMIALGALSEKTGLFRTESVVSVLTDLLPPYRHKLIPHNQRALERGKAFVREGNAAVTP